MARIVHYKTVLAEFVKTMEPVSMFLLLCIVLAVRISQVCFIEQRYRVS